MSIILYQRGSLEDKLSSSLLMSEKPETDKLKRHQRCSLRQKMNIVEKDLGHLHPLLHKTDHLMQSLSQTGEGRHEESGGGCSGCGFRGEQCSASCYHSGQNRSLNWRASPTPRINWGVLMDSEWIN